MEFGIKIELFNLKTIIINYKTRNQNTKNIYLYFKK